MRIYAAQRLQLAGAKETKAAQVLIEKKLAHYDKVVHELESQKTNPTVRDAYYRAVGARDALDAVLHALSGKMKDLNML